MKTIDNLRQYLPVAAISFVMLASSVPVLAQGHHGEGRRDNEHEHGKKEYRESERDNYRTANNNWNDDRDRNYEKRRWNERDDRSEYHPQYARTYRYGDSEYFEHPRYGRVYQRFDRTPIVLRHDRDDYYYYRDHFYTYRPGIGYCAVEFPRNIFFSQLPLDCDQVYIDGRLFFRNGDLYFRHYPDGYRVVPSPIGITITARF